MICFKLDNVSPTPSLSSVDTCSSPDIIEQHLNKIISVIQLFTEDDITIENQLKEKIRTYLKLHLSSDLATATNTFSNRIENYFTRNLLINELTIEKAVSSIISELEIELEIEKTTPPEVLHHIQSSPYLKSCLTSQVGVVFQDMNSETSLFSRKTPLGLTVHAFKKGEELGTGGFGTVFAIDSIVRPVIEGVGELVIKESTLYEASQKSVEQEYKILQNLHEKKEVIGIQSPIYLVKTSDARLAYFGKKFGKSLSIFTELPKPKTSGMGLLIDCYTLLLGLNFIHANGVVHGDIKPANLCTEIDENGHEEFKLADFGTSRLIDQITLDCVFPVFSRKYVHPNDLKAARNIEKFGTTSDEEAKRLKQDEIILVQKQDVYALGKSLSEIFEDVDLLIPEVKEQFNSLVSAMMNPDYKQRIDSHRAAEEYLRILQSLL